MAAAESTRRHVAMFDYLSKLVRHGISEVNKGATDIHSMCLMLSTAVFHHFGLAKNVFSRILGHT